MICSIAEWLTLLNDLVHKTWLGGGGGSRFGGVESRRFRFASLEARRRPGTLSSAVVSPASVAGRGVVSSFLIVAEPGALLGWFDSSVGELARWLPRGRGGGTGVVGTSTPPRVRVDRPRGLAIDMSPSFAGLWANFLCRSSGEAVGSAECANTGLSGSYAGASISPISGCGVEGVDDVLHLVPLPNAW